MADCLCGDYNINRKVPSAQVGRRRSSASSCETNHVGETAAAYRQRCVFVPQLESDFSSSNSTTIHF
jgi:hypothetical protein